MRASPENPFRLPHSEAITSDVTFLRLFGPNILDALPQKDPWRQFTVFRSPAGGGKTTLLRLFTPSCLMRLVENHGTEDLRELFKKLKALDAVGDHAPKLLGVLLSGIASYSSIEDLNLPDPSKLRLFNAMLDARIVLGALAGIAEVARLSWPDELDRIKWRLPAGLIEDLPPEATGKALFAWAKSKEAEIWSTIDSFSAPQANVHGHDTLHMLSALQPDAITVDGHALVQHCIVMVDESWRLTSRQQNALKETVQKIRPTIGVWLAERFEALSDEELFAGSSLGDRDRNPVVYLNSFWSSRRVFETVANKRVQIAPVGLTRFVDILGTGQNSPHDVTYQEIGQQIHRRMSKKTQGALKYKTFLEQSTGEELSDRDRMIELRSKEILLERDLRKTQLSFDLDVPSGLEDKGIADLRAIAEFLACREWNLPFFYGMDRLSKLASENAYQFMFLATELFDEILSKEVLSEPLVLDAEVQDRLVRRAARHRFDETLRSAPTRKGLQNFLEAFKVFAHSETYRPNVPYGGVTGFSITTEDHKKLLDSRVTRDKPYTGVADLLATCLVQNIFWAETDHKQGEVGKTWTIFYLNRLFCVHLDLPLNLGGYRAKTIKELESWMLSGKSSGSEDRELPYDG